MAGRSTGGLCRGRRGRRVLDGTGRGGIGRDGIERRVTERHGGDGREGDGTEESHGQGWASETGRERKRPRAKVEQDKTGRGKAQGEEARERGLLYRHCRGQGSSDPSSWTNGSRLRTGRSGRAGSF
jgi:hypothetical protein